MEECCFEIFPDVLLQQIWPAERIMEGVRTCWFLRAKLPLLVEEAVLSDPESQDWENQLFTALCRFRFHKISLDYQQIYAYPLSYTAFQRVTIRTKAHKRSLVLEDFVHFHRIQCGLKREREREIAARNPRLLRTMLQGMPLGLGPALVCLDLSNRAMGVRGAQLLARVLENCVQLLRLDLASNFIQTEGMSLLADAAVACYGLQRLNLRRNHILWHDPGAAQLARFLAKCPRVSRLDLSENDVHWQSDDDDLQFLLAQRPPLADLELGCNPNTSKPAVQSLVTRCSAFLTRLDLRSHRMGNQHAASLVHALASCPLLACLNLSNNEVDHTACHVIAPSLAACRALTALDLSHNPLCQGLAVLAPALAELPFLSNLSLRDTSTSLDSASLLLALLFPPDGFTLAPSPRPGVQPGNDDSEGPDTAARSSSPARSTGSARPALSALDLSCNALSSAELAALAALVLQGAGGAQIRELRLGQTAVASDSDGEGDTGWERRRRTETLARAGPLNLNRKCVAAVRGFRLASLFDARRPMRVLELRGCGLGRHGAGVLGRAVAGWGGWLERLDLTGNGIGDDGAEGLGEGLQVCCPGVRVLQLAGNGIGAGAERVVEGAARWLQEIELGENEVDCHTATGLARALRGCRVLQRVSLEGNQIGEAGTEALMAALEGGCGSWALLDLQGNPVSAEGGMPERGGGGGPGRSGDGERARGRRAVLSVSMSESVAAAWEDDELARTRGRRVKEWQRKREQAGERPAGGGMGGHWFALGTSMGLR